MKINEVTGINTELIANKIKRLNLKGFGGLCPEAAIAINKNVFQNKGQLVGAFNRAFLMYGKHPLGHVAVLYNGDYWDSDARPKTLDEIESWGMLDPSDVDYEELADDYGFDWNDETASEVEIINFNDGKSLLGVFHRG